MTAFFKPESIHPLNGVDPNLPVDDLGVLGDITAKAEIVALGEPTHGQKEINQLRDRMSRYLIEHHGFRVIAMEDSAIKCRLVNDSIVHGKGTADSALRQQNFWTWRTREVLAMIEWLREWNLAHPDDIVRFIGIDFQDISTPVSELIRVLSQQELPTTGPWQSILVDIGAIPIWGQSNFEEQEVECYLSTLSEIREAIISSKSISPDDLEIALDCVLSVNQSLHLWKEIAASPDEVTPARWNRRDEAMAARAIAATDDGHRVILWAQNGHIQSEPLPGLPRGARTMGQTLRNRFSCQYVVISGMFGSGGYRGFDQDAAALSIADVGEPPIGSLDFELWNSRTESGLLIDLSSPNAKLFEAQSTRWAGAAIEAPDNMIMNVRPAIGSNAIAFVREASPAEPI